MLRPHFPLEADVCSVPRPVVLDTNIVLDLLVFADAGTQPLELALAARQVEWLATPAMRDELERVLGYPPIASRLERRQLSAAQVLLQFDSRSRRVDVAPAARLRCSDPDDQKFIDLAVAHHARLLSKDRAVLRTARRLQIFESIGGLIGI